MEPLSTRIVEDEIGKKVTGQIFRGGFWDEVISFSYHPWSDDWGADTSTCLPSGTFEGAKQIIELYGEVLAKVEEMRQKGSLVRRQHEFIDHLELYYDFIGKLDAVKIGVKDYGLTPAEAAEAYNNSEVMKV